MTPPLCSLYLLNLGPCDAVDPPSVDLKSVFVVELDVDEVPPPGRRSPDIGRLVVGDLLIG